MPLNPTNQQVGRVSMGSFLGPALANNFIGFYEKELLSSPNKPEVYFHFVDNTFCLFNNETEVDSSFLLPLIISIQTYNLHWIGKLISHCPF